MRGVAILILRQQQQLSLWLVLVVSVIRFPRTSLTLRFRLSGCFPRDFGNPLWWPSSSLAGASRKSLQSKNCYFDVFPLIAELAYYSGDIHRVFS
jgi:hypothetical protein